MAFWVSAQAHCVFFDSLSGVYSACLKLCTSCLLGLPSWLSIYLSIYLPVANCAGDAGSAECYIRAGSRVPLGSALGSGVGCCSDQSLQRVACTPYAMFLGCADSAAHRAEWGRFNQRLQAVGFLCLFTEGAC